MEIFSLIPHANLITKNEFIGIPEDERLNKLVLEGGHFERPIWSP